MDGHGVAPHTLLVLTDAAIPAIVGTHIAELTDAPVVDSLAKELLCDCICMAEQCLLKCPVAFVCGLLQDACECVDDVQRVGA